MPAATRSSQRLASASADPAAHTPADTSNSSAKRKAPASKGTKAKRTKTTQDAVAPAISLAVVPPEILAMAASTDALIPAELSFSFDDAKEHLISVDPRFEDVFNKMKCTPYEVLERVHPFRSLATSIIGQQISWKAARSINHKFKRLYDPSIPEDISVFNDTDRAEFFPTPAQVAATDAAVLRTAGLSGRKAEYIHDLAARFADGRLTTEKLTNATDEELSEMLIAVKGIGKWTIDMFAIFSLRRPNIMPVGDLGVQRGVLRWFLSLHSPDYNYALEAEKVSEPDVAVDEKEGAIASQPEARGTTPDVSSVVPAVPSTPKRSTEELPSVLPQVFTPSINRTLRKTQDTDFVPSPLPDGLTAAAMKSRLSAKKKIKGALLTPKEMEDLTEPWKPYRSLGVYYMWALADG